MYLLASARKCRAFSSGRSDKWRKNELTEQHATLRYVAPGCNVSRFRWVKGARLLHRNSAFRNIPRVQAKEMKSNFRIPLLCNLRRTRSSSALKRATRARTSVLFCENNTLDNAIRGAFRANHGEWSIILLVRVSTAMRNNKGKNKKNTCRRRCLVESMNRKWSLHKWSNRYVPSLINIKRIFRPCFFPLFFCNLLIANSLFRIRSRNMTDGDILSILPIAKKKKTLV